MSRSTKKKLRIAAVVCVDVSPRWIYYGRKALTAKAEPDSQAMAVAQERISTLLALVAESLQRLTHIRDYRLPPPIVVESDQLDRVALGDLRGKGALALCGVYGDGCVLDVAERLKVHGYEVVILEDACLWSAPPEMLLEEEEQFARRVSAFERVRAAEIFSELTEENPDLWTGDPPSF